MMLWDTIRPDYSLQWKRNSNYHHDERNTQVYEYVKNLIKHQH
jgi:hypothetical protein